MFGQDVFSGEVFDELDDLETLPRRELQKRTEEAQAFNGATCRRAKLEMEFSREIEVLHLAPMTSIGLRDPSSRSRSRNRTPQLDAMATTSSRPRCAAGLARWLHIRTDRLNREGCNYDKEQPIRQVKLSAQRCFVCIAPRQFRITGICTAVTHLRQEASSITPTAVIAVIGKTFRLVSDVNGGWRSGLGHLPRIHVIVESYLGGCIIDEMKVDLAAGLQRPNWGTGEAERRGKTQGSDISPVRCFSEPVRP
ncbi:hypothetical protein JQ607_32660 [Bradyrhizobium liaoningense]|nr:hypothetical protein [Bradyrhizobium liaoningense]